MSAPNGTTGSTMPRRQLGRRLRELRNRAGMTTRTAAQRLEWSEAKIWRIETGQTSLRSLDVEAMCKVYGATGDLVGSLASLARETKSRGWWTAFGDVIGEGFDVYVGLEEAARRLSAFETDLIPGLLQTEAYARSMFTAAFPDASEAAIERRWRFREARQEVLTRATSPVELDAVIGEAALRHAIGDGEVAEEQLAHLRRAAEAPNVRIRVVPSGCGYHDGLDSGRFVLLDFPEAAAAQRPEPAVVYVESFSGPVYLEKDAEVRRFRRAFAGIEAVAVELEDLPA